MRRRYVRYLLIMFAALMLPLAQPSYSQTPPEPSSSQKTTIYSKPAVVRVVAGCSAGYDKGVAYFYAYGGQGSGLFITPDGYIATRKVIKSSDCRQKLAQRLAEDSKRDNFTKKFNVNEADGQLEDFKYIHFVVLPNPNAEEKKSKTLEFEVIRSSDLDDGKDVSIIKVEIENAPALVIQDSNQVEVQEEVVAIGYPTSTDLNRAKDESREAEGAYEEAKKAYYEFLGIALPDPKAPIQNLSELEISSYEASVIEGKVSNPNQKLGDSPVLQLDMRSTGYGSAGSPVLDSDGKVVGMLGSQDIDNQVFELLYQPDVDKFNNRSKDAQSSIPLAIPASTIQQFARESGVINRQDSLDQYYREGLNLYWQGKYDEAKEKFEAVRGAFPQHSEADRLIRACDKNKVKAWSQPQIAFWGAIAAVVALLLGFIFFLMRRKPSAAPRPSADVRPFARHSPTGAAKSNNSKTQTWLELEGVGETRKLPLYKDTHRIGRDPAWSDIEMPASWEVLSRHHAHFKREGNSYRVFDGDGKVQSRNGLVVDDYDKVDSVVGHLLRPGDTLTIGSDPREQVRITYFNSAAGQAKDETKAAT